MEDKREALIEAGRNRFRKTGFKKTGVADVAKDTGIAVGSFYKYFDSKEELFYRIYVRENEQLKQRLFDNMDIKDDPVALVTKLVSENAFHMNKNPILREWYNTDLMAKLEYYFRKGKGVESIE